MSNIVQGLVWDAEIPNAIAKVIAVKLADWADDDGGSIYPSVPTIAQKTACGQSTVRRWLQAFEQCGLLKVVSRSRGGARTDTTERAFDIDLLRRLAWTKRGRIKTPPELRVMVKSATRKAACALEIVPYATGEDRPAPKLTLVPQEPISPREGSEINTPLAPGGVPLSPRAVTPLAPGPDLSSINHYRRSDPSNLNSDVRKTRPAQLPKFVSEDALNKVRAIAPGWDRQMLLKKFLDWEGSKSAEHMDKAFLGWAKKFTKGRAAA